MKFSRVYNVLKSNFPNFNDITGERTLRSQGCPKILKILTLKVIEILRKVDVKVTLHIVSCHWFTKDKGKDKYANKNVIVCFVNKNIRY